MRSCPFCKGQVPDDALKCQHCGEWVDGCSGGSTSEVGKAVLRFVNVYIVISAIGMLLAILLLCFYVLPLFNSVRRDFGR